MITQSRRQSSRLGGANVYQGGPKFEIKPKSYCIQKGKLVNWGGQAPLVPLWRRSCDNTRPKSCKNISSIWNLLGYTGNQWWARYFLESQISVSRIEIKQKRNQRLQNISNKKMQMYASSNREHMDRIQL